MLKMTIKKLKDDDGYSVEINDGGKNTDILEMYVALNSLIRVVTESTGLSYKQVLKHLKRGEKAISSHVIVGGKNNE